MRRPTKATTSSSSSRNRATNTAAFSTGYENLPTSSSSSHLELSSASADDNENTSKIHKKKNKQRGSQQRGSSIAIATVCSLIAFGTLYFVAKYVSSMVNIGGAKSRSTTASIHHQQRKTLLAENNNNVDADKYNHHHYTNQLPPDSIYRAKVTDIHGTLQDLHQYAGSISLVVNVACE